MIDYFFFLRDAVYSDTREGARDILISSLEINGITLTFSRSTLLWQVLPTSFKTKSPQKLSVWHWSLYIIYSIIWTCSSGCSMCSQIFKQCLSIPCFKTLPSPKWFSRTYKLYSSFLITSTQSGHGDRGEMHHVGRLSISLLQPFGVINSYHSKI